MQYDLEIIYDTLLKNHVISNSSPIRSISYIIIFKSFSVQFGELKTSLKKWGNLWSDKGHMLINTFPAFLMIL